MLLLDFENKFGLGLRPWQRDWTCYRFLRKMIEQSEEESYERIEELFLSTKPVPTQQQIQKSEFENQISELEIEEAISRKLLCKFEHEERFPTLFLHELLENRIEPCHRFYEIYLQERFEKIEKIKEPFRRLFKNELQEDVEDSLPFRT